MSDFYKVSTLVAEFKGKLDVIIKRDGSRHQMDAHIPMDVMNLLEDELQPILKDLIAVIEWEPGDEDLCPAEPPITMAEMHQAAWVQHVQMHS
jgi:hypothetical protein